MTSATVSFAAGEIIFREGDAPTTAFLVESGATEIFRGSPEAPQTLGQLGPGDLLGEMAVIDDSPRSASARAASDCVLTVIDHFQLRERLENADPIVRALLLAQLRRYRNVLSGLDRRAVLRSRAVPRTPGKLDALLAPAAGKIRLESQLMEAIDHQTLALQYQPIVGLVDNEVRGYEALVRWHHPERGIISPAEFIQLAEETELILPVGRYVLDHGCSALAKLAKCGRSDLHIAINTSARQLLDDKFLAEIESALKHHAVPPRALHVEITESLILDLDSVKRFMNGCREIGVDVLLDDFGTGYSNLGHVHTLTFDTIKLDQGFSRQALGSTRCLSVCKAIIDLSRALDAEIVVEGIETEAQRDLFRDLGCEYGQGWYFGKPLDVGTMLASHGYVEDSPPATA